jgi:hypothetical protein
VIFETNLKTLDQQNLSFKAAALASFFLPVMADCQLRAAAASYDKATGGKTRSEGHLHMDDHLIVLDL